MKILGVILSILLCCIDVLAQDTICQGLDVVFLGDSNTWLGGDNCTKTKGWNTHFCNIIHPKSQRSYARSGATWTNTPLTTLNTQETSGSITDNNVIYNQVFRLVEAVENDSQRPPELILIMCGTNDGWFLKKRPNALSEQGQNANNPDTINWLPSTVLTITESVSQNCAILKAKFPTAKIVLITPMQTTQASNAIIEQIGNLIEQTGGKMGIPVIRLDRISPVRSASERIQKRYTYDGTHTSELGARKNAEAIAAEISKFQEFDNNL